jgi:type IV pilus assembly protein PilC
MPRYQYFTRNKSGKAEEGISEVKSEDELIALLHAQGLTVISFKEVSAAVRDKKAFVFRPHRLHGKASLDDLITFARQLIALLGAGITLLRTLEIISMQVESRALFKALESIKRDISAGSSFKVAIEKYPSTFSNLWVNIIETGETTGQLPFALGQLASYLESASALRRKIKNALIYPSVIVCVAIAAVSVFIVMVIPMFNNIYRDFNAQLPLFTTIVFGVCMGIKNYLLFIIVMIIASVFAVRYYGKTPTGKRQLDKLVLNIFLVGDIIRQISTVRFASGLNMLIKSGTPILHALDIVIETTNNVMIKDMLGMVKQSVREGRGMGEALLLGGIFPPMLGHMISVGEESGELANMLDNAGRFYSERVDATVTRLATLFEPLLIVIIGCLIGTLIIAMFLPIFTISSGGLLQ